MSSNSVINFKGNITDLDIKADVLINFVSPQYNEVYENKIGIVEKTPLLSEKITKELAENPKKKAVITKGEGLYTDYIIHMIKQTTSPMLNNISMGYYICETTILTALYETLKLKDVETVAVPLIGGQENQDIISLATVNACRRFYEEHPESSVRLIIIVDSRVNIGNNSNVDIDIAAQTAEISKEIIEKLKEVSNQEDFSEKKLGSLENIKFIEFGSEQGNTNVSFDEYIGEDYNKSSSFLTSEEIDKLLFEDDAEDLDMDSNSQEGTDGINKILEEITEEMGNDIDLDGVATIMEIIGLVLMNSKDSYNLNINVSKSGKLNIRLNIE